MYLKKILWHSSIIFAFLLVLISTAVFGLLRGTGSVWADIRAYIYEIISGRLWNIGGDGRFIKEFIRLYPRTLLLAFAAFSLAIIAGVIIGMLFSYKGGSRKKSVFIFSSTIPVSLPDVLVILSLQNMMIFLKKSGLPYLPVAGFSSAANVVLPVISLAIIPAVHIARVTFINATEAYNEKFILTSRAKGSNERRVLLVHVWKKIYLQVLQSFYTIIPLIISSLLIVETLFYYPGLSFALFDAVKKYDVDKFIVLAIALGTVYLMLAAFVYILFFISRIARRQNL